MKRSFVKRSQQISSTNINKRKNTKIIENKCADPIFKKVKNIFL